MKVIKRTLAVLLSACMLFAMASCSSKDSYYKKAGAAWAIDAYKALPEEFNEDTCNQFWFAGDVFEFPMKADEFFDKGWEIVDVYQEDVDENYPLDPLSVYELCLNKDGAGMMVWIYNDSAEPKPVKECLVVYLRIGHHEEALLPGGTLLDTYYKTLDEALAAFNKDMTELDKEDCVYGYQFDAEGFDNCSVRFDISDSPQGYYVANVAYYVFDPADLPE